MLVLFDNGYLDNGNEKKQVGEEKEYDDSLGKDIFHTRFLKYSAPFMKTKVAEKISVLTFCQFCPRPNPIRPSEVTQQ